MNDPGAQVTPNFAVGMKLDLIGNDVANNAALNDDLSRRHVGIDPAFRADHYNVAGSEITIVDAANVDDIVNGGAGLGHRAPGIIGKIKPGQF